MKSPSDKMMRGEELQQKAGKRVRSFYVPEFGVTVEADSVDEAVEKARKTHETNQ